jgi:hypothetical protein
MAFDRIAAITTPCGSTLLRIFTALVLEIIGRLRFSEDRARNRARSHNRV